MTDAASFRELMARKYATAEDASAPSSPDDLKRKMEEKYKAVGTAEDVGRGALAGLVSGTGGALDLANNLTPTGMIDNAVRLGAKAAEWYDPEKYNGLSESAPRLSPKYSDDLSKLTGGVDKYEPKTVPGEYARTIGEFAPGMVAPGGLAKNAVTNVIVPALASETASQWVRNTSLKDYDPYVRLAAAIPAGLASGKLWDSVSLLATSGATKAASRILADTATDPKKAVEEAKKVIASKGIDGTQLTLAEATGDVGLARGTKDFAEGRQGMVARLNEQRATSNAARLSAIDDLAPVGADTMLPSQRFRAALDDIENTTQAELSRLGNIGSNLDEVGQKSRATLEQIKTAEKARIGKLYDAIDPDGTLAVVTSGVRDAARNIVAGIGKYADPIGNDEKRLLSLASKMDEATKFSDVRDLEKGITAAIARAKLSGDNVSASRLTNLKSVVRSSIDDAVDNQSAWKMPDNYSGLMPNAVEDTGKALSEANRGYADFAKKFRSGMVGQLLDSETGYRGQYSLKDPAVASRVFQSGDSGYANATSFLRAADNHPDAIQSLKDTALIRLRDEMKGGQLTPEALSRWQQKYGNALRAINDIDPGFMRTVSNAADARAAVAIDSVSRLVGARSADEVRGVVGNLIASKDGAGKISDLIAAAKGDQEIIDGLRAAGAKYIRERFTGAGDALTPQRLRDFISGNRDSLRALYGDDGLNTLESISEELRRSQFALDASKVKGMSETPSALRGHLAKIDGAVREPSLVQMVGGIFYNAAALGQWATTGITGVGLAIRKIQTALSKAGIRNVDDLVERAMLDKDFGAALLEAGIKDGRANQGAIDRMVKILNATNATRLPADIQERIGRKSGGRVDDHASEASRLIAAAEHAKKQISSGTEHLLGTPDDVVARALEAANRGI